MVTWPNALSDKPLVSGMSEVLEDTIIRTEMDQGPDKIRQRSTAGVRNLGIGFILDKEQITTLNEFYLFDLKGGSLSFLYSHPRDNSAINCRFLKPPEYSSINGNYYNVKIKLEVLP